MRAVRADCFHVCVFRPNKYGMRAAILNPMPLWRFLGREGLDFHTLRFWLAFLPPRDSVSLWGTQQWGSLVLLLVRSPCQATALGGLDPVSRHCLIPESSPTVFSLPTPSPLAPYRKCLRRGRCWSRLCGVTRAAFQSSPLWLKYILLSSLVVPISSSGGGGDVVCVPLFTQVPGTWAANSLCQAVSPQRRAWGRKAFMLHTGEATSAEPSTCSEKLVTRAHPSWKR